MAGGRAVDRWPDRACDLQMLTIAFHEFGHAMAACLTGGRVKSISLDPREGGVTHMQGGINAITLPAGYLGSSFIGALLIFCGFNIVASKVASIALGVCFLLTLWVSAAPEGFLQLKVWGFTCSLDMYV